jgi:hypothetical protein
MTIAFSVWIWYKNYLNLDPHAVLLKTVVSFGLFKVDFKNAKGQSIGLDLRLTQLNRSRGTGDWGMICTAIIAAKVQPLPAALARASQLRARADSATSIQYSVYTRPFITTQITEKSLVSNLEYPHRSLVVSSLLFPQICVCFTRSPPTPFPLLRP